MVQLLWRDVEGVNKRTAPIGYDITLPATNSGLRPDVNAAALGPRQRGSFHLNRGIAQLHTLSGARIQGLRCGVSRCSLNIAGRRRCVNFVFFVTCQMISSSLRETKIAAY